jgi:hypothetical protein
MEPSRENLREFIRNWIRVENEIRQLSIEIKKRRIVKEELTSSLLDIMKTNEIDCFDVNNGKLSYAKTKVRTPLNQTQMLEALMTYYKDDPEIAKSLTKHLLDSRTEKVKETIKMKIKTPA